MAGARKNLVLLFVLSMLSDALGGEFYVAPDGKDNNAGTVNAPWTLSKANVQAKPGDTVILMDGAYSTAIAPASSGREGALMTFRAMNAGRARFEGGPLEDQAAIQLSGRSYVLIDGMTVKNVRRFIMAEGKRTHHITISHCTFAKTVGSSFESCRFRDVGDGIRVTDCSLTQGNDLLAITGGNGHLVENNFFGDASHTGLVLIMVQRSVVRNNLFTNLQWKMMEVFSTRDTREPHRLSEYNLIENNRFDTTVSSGIQYAGNRTILRRNVFHRCRVGLNWANYRGRARTPEAWYDQHNRFYNNVILECGPSPANLEALAASGVTPAEEDRGQGVAMEFATNINPPEHYGDEVCVNNVLYGNVGVGEKMASTAQISFTWDATPEFGTFFHNVIMAAKPDQPVVFWLDASHEKSSMKRNMRLKEFQEAYPGLAANNLEADPQFVNPGKGDFHLKPTSPCIDAGAPLTKVAADANGRVVKVLDALFFTDGYGIKGVDGDVIRIGRERLTVVKVDYRTHELTLNRAVVCKAGDAVNVDYLGNAPDIGAFECR